MKIKYKALNLFSSRYISITQAYKDKQFIEFRK